MRWDGLAAQPSSAAIHMEVPCNHRCRNRQTRCRAGDIAALAPNNDETSQSLINSPPQKSSLISRSQTGAYGSAPEESDLSRETCTRRTRGSFRRQGACRPQISLTRRWKVQLGVEAELVHRG